MGSTRVRPWALVICAAALALAPVAARAGETARTFADLQGRVMLGETVTVTDQAGQVTKGKLVSITPTELTLNTGAGPRTVVGGELTKVQARRMGPLWNGALIGGVIGAAPGLIAMGACDGGCGDSAAGVAIGAAIGAGIGVGIDALWKGNVTVMKVEDAGAKKVSLAPLVGKGRKGVLCSVRF